MTNKKPKPRDKRLYELEVCLFSGQVSEKFAEANPVVSRTIQIRGNQTLQDLHTAIFDAFDRFDEHMYEFQIGGKKPMDPEADRYVLPVMLDGPYDDGTAAVHRLGRRTITRAELTSQAQHRTSCLRCGPS